MRKVKKLFPGARVAVLAASSPVPDERLPLAEAAVKNLGLVPVMYESSHSRHGYLAGDDALRANDINRAFADDSIDGILCIRGGYGAHRLMGLLDMNMIAAHPKYFSGYSDVTALTVAFNEVCDFMTYHTLMPSTCYYKPIDDYSMDYLRRAMFGSLSGELKNPDDKPELTALVSGKAEGMLTGGNLSLLAASIGTPWEVNTKGKILFMEDVGEEPYRIDGMLTHMRNAGKFDDAAGIICGWWTDCDAKTPEKSLTMDDVFAELLAPAGKPTVMGLCCGHSMPSASLPMGAQVSIDGNKVVIL